MKEAKDKICDAVTLWNGVAVHTHKFGGIEFRLGKRELGHVHGNSLLDIPFPMKVRNTLIDARRVRPHHILPSSGWVSFYLKSDSDIEEAINLLRLSYDIASKKISLSDADEKTKTKNLKNDHQFQTKEISS